MRAQLGSQLVRQALMPVGVLGAWVAVLVWLIASLGETADWVDHTDQVIAQLNQLEAGVLEQMAAVRGFMLTSEESFLQRYQDGASIDRTVAAIRSLVRDNPPQGERVGQVAGLVADWRAAADAEIALVRRGGQASDILRSRAEPLERAIRARLLEMREVEARLREERVSRATRTRTWTLAGTTALGITLGGILGFVGIRAVRKVAADYEAAQADLERDAARLAEAETQLRQYATGLEQRVAERTSELAGANAQLEAFGYSVSHDLRAPLRGMQGLAQAIVEDYGDRLDATGRDYAQRIVSEAALMDGLIQDLLAYSRLTRVEMALEPVPIRQVIDDALHGVRGAIAEAQANVHVAAADLVVRANRSVLQQILTNLLSNAVKFGGREPQIDLVAEQQGPAALVTVVDRGIGISPEHHRQVFGVFERLHSTEQYPGTGIGLAIVKKGVERMGGTVGVESSRGAGSRFWFTVPLDARG